MATIKYRSAKHSDRFIFLYIHRNACIHITDTHTLTQGEKEKERARERETHRFGFSAPILACAHVHKLQCIENAA